MAGEELERGPVEPFDVFVQAGVGEVLEDHQFAPVDPVVDPLGEARRADQVARADGDDTVVASGLSQGEQVVTVGQLRLAPGTRVNPAKAPAPS